jgi:hypothetical protein
MVAEYLSASVRGQKTRHLLFEFQVIDREKLKERGYSVTKIVADAGIEAAQKPIKLLVPIVAGIFSLRTVSLALQIFVENEMFRNTNRFASTPRNSAPSRPHLPSDQI